MSVHVLGASALIAYLSGEPGAKVVDTLILDSNAGCYVHSINLCEVYYDAVRKTTVRQARQTIRDLLSVDIIERRDISRRFWQRVGEHKAKGRISLPDCFCISLAQELGGEVVTSDHGEFNPLVPLGIVPIMFIR